MTKNTPYLSVVIPAYKEEENLKKGVLKEVNDYLTKQSYSWEVLVVDDGSGDKTPDLAEAFAKKHKNFSVHREPHRGKGATVIAGVLASKGEIVLFTDMDQATPIEEIEKLLPKFSVGYDIAIGSRANRKGAPVTRKLMAYGFIVLRTLILRLPYKDTQCGFKAFKRPAAQKIFSKMKIFSESKKITQAAVTAGFDLELLYIARKLKYKVAQVPVVWNHTETKRVNPLRDSWHGFRDLLRIRINAIRGLYR
jgi:dolichyl-phosphate beta-glucosyltransferase